MAFRSAAKGQADRKFCPFSRLSIDGDRAPVRLDNTLYNSQP